MVEVMAYKQIDVATCPMDELKKEIKQIHEHAGNGGLPKDPAALQLFVVEANARLKDEIAILGELKTQLIKDALGL